MKLGVPLDLAIACGILSKSYWRSAKLREFIEHYPMNSSRKKACYRCEIGGWKFITVKEPPCVEPHARWCGEGELDARLYPIMDGVQE